MKKPIVVDCGELGWSLYLVGHLRFMLQYYNIKFAVMCYPDRKCLYKNIADEIYDIPDEFYKKFDTSEQECFGIEASSDPTSRDKLMAFFIDVIPQDCYIPPGFAFTCKSFGLLYAHEPFKYTVELPDHPKEILVFPRARGGRFVPRDIPREFYVQLINRLCEEFDTKIVRTVGTLSGAYKIKQEDINKALYLDGVKEKPNLQELINFCQVAVAAVGSQSAPGKISLLQGVPTFMIGHEKERHTKTENWKGTKYGFYETHNYQQFDFKLCIDNIISFIRSLDESPLIISNA